MNQAIIKRLLSYLRQDKSALIAAMIFALFSVGANLYAPLLIGDIIDDITNQIPFDEIIQRLILLILLYCIASLATWLMMLFSNRVAFTFSYKLRKALIKKLELLPISYYDTHDHGDIMTRFSNDIELLSDGLIQALSTLLSGAVTIIAVVFFMLNINLTMTIIVILCAPFTFLVAKFIASHSHKFFIAQANDSGKINAFTQEMLQGIHTLKLFNQEKKACEQFQALNDQLYVSGKNSQFYGSLVNPSTRLVTNGAYTIVGISATFLALMGKITMGNISSFLIYSNTFAKPFNEISGVMTQLQAALAGAQRVFALLDKPQEDNEAKSELKTCQGHIEFKAVSFGYEPNHLLMNHLSLDIPAGNRIAVVGKTGAGKTTLINLIMRFYELNDGQILLDGVDIAKLSREQLRAHFGMVLQDTYLGEDTIRNIIAYGKREAGDDEIISAAKESGAHEFIIKLPQGYQTVIHNHSFLSQGQRQLLSVTRVMLMNPQILILDEATSNMDTRSEVHVNIAMEKLMKNKTSFVIAHRLSTILNSDQILVMEQGNIIEQGTHEELLQKQGAYASLYQSQFKAAQAS